MGGQDSRHAAAIQYHQRTKHHYGRYARSLGYLDWDTQPDPFRTYAGSQQIPLPLLERDTEGAHIDLYIREGKQAQPIKLETIAAFLELSLGLSAWKAAGSAKWALRINPSSGNLHPTEAHLVLPPLRAVSAGVFHYNPLQHALECRCEIPPDLWQDITRYLDSEGFLIGLASIFWREAWKYGERAYRYCNLDVGHALACLSFSANLLGWQMVYLNALSTEEIEGVLGFNRTAWPAMEAEHADLLCWVRPHESGKDVRYDLPEDILSQFEHLPFLGTPNHLSPSHVEWELIYQTADALCKPRTAPQVFTFGTQAFASGMKSPFSAAEIIRKRRSGVRYNPHNSWLSQEAFLGILDRTRPRDGSPPFDIRLGETCIHLLVFIHNVGGFKPGLYLYLRQQASLSALKGSLSPPFLWQEVVDGFPLYQLVKGDMRRKAIELSCHQAIAGDSAFSLGMIARFEQVIEREPYRYPALYWEAGMIGQVLYLEAEAQGCRATGIGCFFDDGVHELLGLRDLCYQCLYHFTFGAGVEDERLSTYPPYNHRGRA